MIHINLQNIEELLFKNSKIKPLLPDLKHIFDKWLLSYPHPALGNMRKQALLELLNAINANHVEKLAKILGDMVFITKLDYHIVKNLTLNELTKYKNYDNFAICKNKNEVKITLWR